MACTVSPFFNSLSSGIPGESETQDVLVFSPVGCGTVLVIAIEAAEKIISESLDKEKQKKLVNDFLSKVPNN